MFNTKQLISWYQLTLTRIDINAGKDLDIQDEFQSLYEHLDRPEDISLFRLRDPSSEPMLYYVSTDDENNFHTKLIQYFVKKFQGVPCEEPGRDLVSPLITNNPGDLFRAA